MPRGNKKSGVVHNGFLNFYKPVGITSMDGLRRIKAITGQRQKVGHAGTMDPLAQGVLPICFGQATRLMEYVLSGVKRYRVGVQLGETTATFDAEGEAVKSGDPGGLTQQDVEAVLPAFTGVVQQTPPMYSAVKVNGQRLYKLARAGIEVEREARTVEIYDIEIVEFDNPRLVLDVECGRGVYMRSLAHDIGAALGCGAYVSDLVRSSSCGFSIEDAVTLEDLEAANAEQPDGWLEHLQPIDAVLTGLRGVTVNRQAEQYLRNGQSVGVGRAAPDAGFMEQFRIYSEAGCFLALARCESATWKPVKVFQNLEPSPYAPRVSLR